mgnify:FL=1
MKTLNLPFNTFRQWVESFSVKVKASLCLGLFITSFVALATFFKQLFSHYAF